MHFGKYRSLERWKNSKYFEYNDVDEFLLSEVNSGLHSIFEGGVALDIHANINKNNPLVVFLNGNAPRSEELKLPVFAGFGVSLQLHDISRICISDSSLYLSPELCLSWYGGSSGFNLQEILPRILEKIFNAANPNKIIFVGGSGGGFACMYYSRLFPGSLAFVWNPQTDILQYNPSHVVKYASTAFGCIEDFEVARAVLSEVIDVRLSDFYLNNKNYVIYLQNSSDWHVEKHFKPFIKAILKYNIRQIQSSLVRQNLYVHIHDWGNGHVPPPKELISDMLQFLISSEVDWADIFDRGSGAAIGEVLNRSNRGQTTI